MEAERDSNAFVNADQAASAMNRASADRAAAAPAEIIRSTAIGLGR